MKSSSRMHAVTIDHVKDICSDFLHKYFGAPDHDADEGELGLRLVCLGNAERTVQGELVHFFRKNELNAISECGVVEKISRYSLDIVVFDEVWKPVCVIELKHHSANQGSAGELIKGLRRDVVRHRGGPQRVLPLIQIGLFTEISDFNGVIGEPLEAGLHRFLRTYFRRIPKQTIESQVIPESFGALLANKARHRVAVGEAVAIPSSIA